MRFAYGLSCKHSNPTHQPFSLKTTVTEATREKVTLCGPIKFFKILWKGSRKNIKKNQNQNFPYLYGPQPARKKYGKERNKIIEDS